MSEIKVDTLTGKTSAGDITVTSEGGAVTFQLQQGLAKSWSSFTGIGTVTITDSFNVASLTDNAAGSYDTNFTNSMSSGSFAITVNSDSYATNSAFNRTAAGSNNTTAKGHLRHYESNSLADTSLLISTVNGDLA